MIWQFSSKYLLVADGNITKSPHSAYPFSFSRTQAEMGHTCRGTINLATANIAVEDSCNFVISNGGAQTYHLKASSEVERQRWITALELAKAKAVHMQAESGEIETNWDIFHRSLNINGMCLSDIICTYALSIFSVFSCHVFVLGPISPDDSGDECPAVPPTSGQGGGGRNSEVLSTLRILGSKVEDLTTCNDLIVKHGSALQRYELSEFTMFDETMKETKGWPFIFVSLFRKLICLNVGTSFIKRS